MLMRLEKLRKANLRSDQTYNVRVGNIGLSHVKICLDRDRQQWRKSIPENTAVRQVIRSSEKLALTYHDQKAIMKPHQPKKKTLP